MTSTQKESADPLTGVAETLMITLYARYVETQRSDSFFQDPEAVEIVERTNYDFDKYAKGWASQLGVVVRVQEYDHITQQFLKAHPNAVVVNLGCGLCTRFTRLDNGGVRWYDVDFPEVIEFRQRFFQENDRYRFIPASILDFSWIDQIQHSVDQPLLILMEGVSPYLSEAENRSLILQIRDRLAPAEFVFDVLNRKSANHTARHDTVSKTDAEFKSGIDSGREVETWADGITLKDEVYYLAQFANYPKRLPLWARTLSFIMVPLGSISKLQKHQQS
ncbi:Putative S-adenosyl-L-methionine-dependent methyltransferase [Halomicronema hongdechloris C2206]|uniref:S-adenosyl-L-methionine-dependent methyltransferase n=1 Tax=Halomicronema hongdechloris C2206 TaxID=1641165 RepID=A0A1Z3HU99_9CYAN|nr:class I SAM-dependent methyltransferase [Halomicronema hongdechloris]ASC73707.1 Putative S-adenosyl-L-methionine-dependent methyltransferase [Halomicronema hongdechloris C2206]